MDVGADVGVSEGAEVDVGWRVPVGVLVAVRVGLGVKVGVGEEVGVKVGNGVRDGIEVAVELGLAEPVRRPEALLVIFCWSTSGSDASLLVPTRPNPNCRANTISSSGAINQ
jgi:hypothetical protein